MRSITPANRAGSFLKESSGISSHLFVLLFFFILSMAGASSEVVASCKNPLTARLIVLSPNVRVKPAGREHYMPAGSDAILERGYSVMSDRISDYELLFDEGSYIRNRGESHLRLNSDGIFADLGSYWFFYQNEKYPFRIVTPQASISVAGTSTAHFRLVVNDTFFRLENYAGLVTVDHSSGQYKLPSDTGIEFSVRQGVPGRVSRFTVLQKVPEPDTGYLAPVIRQGTGYVPPEVFEDIPDPEKAIKWLHERLFRKRPGFRVDFTEAGLTKYGLSGRIHFRYPDSFLVYTRIDPIGELRFGWNGLELWAYSPVDGTYYRVNRDELPLNAGNFLPRAGREVDISSLFKHYRLETIESRDYHEIHGVPLKDGLPEFQLLLGREDDSIFSISFTGPAKTWNEAYHCRTASRKQTNSPVLKHDITSRPGWDINSRVDRDRSQKILADVERDFARSSSTKSATIYFSGWEKYRELPGEFDVPAGMKNRELPRKIREGLKNF